MAYFATVYSVLHGCENWPIQRLSVFDWLSPKQYFRLARTSSEQRWGASSCNGCRLSSSNWDNRCILPSTTWTHCVCLPIVYPLVLFLDMQDRAGRGNMDGLTFYRSIKKLTSDLALVAASCLPGDKDCCWFETLRYATHNQNQWLECCVTRLTLKIDRKQPKNHKTCNVKTKKTVGL